jgi:hypothetical protein
MQEVRATQAFGEIFGLIEEPIPRYVRRGDILRLSSIRPMRGNPRPEEFDVWSPSRRIKVLGPLPIAKTRIDTLPGVYKLRFYFPNGHRSYMIYEGPQIEVR